MKTKSVAASVTQFVLAGLAAVVLISAGTFYVVRHNATTEAIRNARDIATVDAHAVAEPLLSDAVLAGDPVATQQLDSVVRQRIIGDRVVRVKLWTPGGRVVYSDEPRLIGRTFSLGSDEAETLKDGQPAADLSDLTEAENIFERQFGKLLQVYVPVHTAGGQPLLFESYLRYSSIAESGRQIWGNFVPVMLGGLLLLFLIQVPLAWSMARGLRQGQEERERLLQRAIDASDAERRRIARDLHDGVVQTLAGVSYSLAAAAERTEEAPNGAEVGSALRQAAADTRKSMRDLRSLIIDIAPPNLHDEGLDNAVGELLAPLAAEGMETTVDIDDDAARSADTQTLLYRVAHEAVRNVAAHARATRLDVSLVRDNGLVRLVVSDNGLGFSADRLDERREEGHVGLSLLTGLVADAGGRLVVTSTPGTGTRLEAEVPA
ncbi:MAG: integral membrane sensor signal transduction histidine kinase [Acidimicrobiia bacterium]|nr:integral membrane sensor signal transduction histidine kinase [Acidimicrobiia bacterium]